MAATSTEIANLSLSRMGQDLIDDIDGTSALEEKCSLIYTQALEELLTEGPELGWKFARKRYHESERFGYTITAIAELVTSSTVTVTATHAFVVGDMVEISGTDDYDGTYDIESISTTVSFVITADFTTTDTGTAYRTSEEFSYYYSIPTSFRIVKVCVGGIETTDWVREGTYLLTNLEDTDVDITYVQSITTTTLFPPWFTAALVLKIAILLHYNITQDLNAIQLLEFDYDRAISKAKAMDEREKYVKEYSTSWVDSGHVTDFIE